MVIDGLLSEFGVVVDVDLAVHAHDLSVGGLRERIDLEQNAVATPEQLVQLLHDVGRLHLPVAHKAELVRQLERLLLGQAHLQVDALLDDGLGILGGDLLDVAATLRARDDHGPQVGAVERDGKVELATRKQTLAHHDHIARLALAARLLRVQPMADHVLGDGLGLLGTEDELHAALHAAVEGALAATARQDLRLHHHVLAKLFFLVRLRII